MTYTILQRYISKNRSHKTLNATGSVFHCTADPGATDEAEFSLFDRMDRNASAHAFVDWDSISNTIPWGEEAWGAGPIANSQFWQIEMCMPKNHDKQMFNAVWLRTVWLLAYLYTSVANPPILTVSGFNTMAHDEARERFKQGTHTDPKAYFAEYGRTFDDFRQAVQLEIEKITGGDRLRGVITWEQYPDNLAADYLGQLKGYAVKHIGGLTDEDRSAKDKLAVGYFTIPPQGFSRITGADRWDTLIEALKNGGINVRRE